MANFPQLDDNVGLWKLKDVNNAVSGGYWRNAGSIGLIGGVGAAVTVDQIKMSTAANSTDFGDLTVAREGMTGMSSFVRGVFGGNQSDTTVIDYCNFNSAGNFADFGDLTEAVGTFGGAASSSTRGIKGGGDTGPSITNIIDYITIASTGNAVDFGDLTAARTTSNASNPTRALFQGGSEPGASNRIDFITIANTGNASDFGDLVATNRSGTGGVTSSTRSVMMGGVDPDGESTTTQFLTIASQGNATEYGDLTRAEQNAAGLSNSVRGICAGGQTPSNTNVIDFFTISVGGTAVDFGDLSAAGTMGGGTSNAHGGLNDGYQGTRFINSPTGAPLRFGGVGVGDIGMFNRSRQLQTVQISTLGNATEFGDGTRGTLTGAAVSSNTRAIYTVPFNLDDDFDNFIDYVEFQSKGNTADFGDITVVRQNYGSCASHVRGVFMGGEVPAASNVMDYITIATIGNATDFGNLTVARGNTAGIGNNTRGLCIGGLASPAYQDVMDYITIASTGDAADFGNLVTAAALPSDGTGGSSTTRGIIHGGGAGPNYYNHIQYITFANTGNTTDFGDATSNVQSGGASGNGVRGLYGGGVVVPADKQSIDYITIATTGNAADFGDLISAGGSVNGTSNCHGGLQS